MNALTPRSLKTTNLIVLFSENCFVVGFYTFFYFFCMLTFNDFTDKFTKRDRIKIHIVLSKLYSSVAINRYMIIFFIIFVVLFFFMNFSYFYWFLLKFYVLLLFFVFYFYWFLLGFFNFITFFWIFCRLY